MKMTLRLLSLLAVLTAFIASVRLAEAVTVTPAQPNITAEVVATGIGFASAFQFNPDGRVFVLSLNDRSVSTIKLPYPASGPKVLWLKFTDIIATPNAGPFGITFHPNYKKNKLVYIYVAGRNVSNSIVNQVVCYKDENGVATDPHVILSIPTPGAIKEEGGYMSFGPDGKLWVIVGQGNVEGSPNIQNLDSLHGKLLRVNYDGSIPHDNPYPNSPVWSWGIRNSFGFAWDPYSPNKKDLRVWETENGDACNDEINLIGKKKNLGYGPIRNCTQPWTVEKTNANGLDVVFPKYVLNAIAPAPRPPSPTGIIFCAKCKLTKNLDGKMLVSFYNTFEIHAFKLNGARNAISKEKLVYKNDASIIGLRLGRDNKIYFSDVKGGASTIKKLVVKK